MVYRKAVAELLEIMRDWSYIYERCRAGYYESNKTPVKKENHLLDVLNRHIPYLQYFFKGVEGYSSPESSMLFWVNHLKQNYGETEADGKPMDLTREDSKKLMEDSENWRKNLISFYSAGSTELIQENSLDNLFPKKKYNKLTKDVKIDLGEGILCILHKQPTSAAMVLFRAAEQMVRVYYKTITGKPSGKISWNDMLVQLEKTKKLKPSVIGYLHYIRDKRNDAQHPSKHFTQIESESILLKIRDLMEEIKH